MELFMVDSLYLKVWWERVVVLGESAAAEYVDLRLHWNSWALWYTVDVDSLMRCEKRVDTMGESARLLIRVEAVQLSTCL